MLYYYDFECKDTNFYIICNKIDEYIFKLCNFISMKQKKVPPIYQQISGTLNSDLFFYLVVISYL